MSANTIWKVRVRKSYTEEIVVSAVTRDEAYNEAMAMHGVIVVEEIKWDSPEGEEYDD